MHAPRVVLRVEGLWQPDEWSGRTAAVASADKSAGPSGNDGCNRNSIAKLLKARRQAEIQRRLSPHLRNRRIGETVGLDHYTIAALRRETESGASAQPITE